MQPSSEERVGVVVVAACVCDWVGVGTLEWAAEGVDCALCDAPHPDTEIAATNNAQRVAGLLTSFVALNMRCSGCLLATAASAVAHSRGLDTSPSGRGSDLRDRGAASKLLRPRRRHGARVTAVSKREL